MPSAQELNDQGAALYTQGDLHGARFYYAAALAEDPDFLFAQKNLAQLCDEMDQHEAGIVLHRRVLAQELSAWRDWNNLGTRLMMLYRYAEAEEAMTQATKIMPLASECWHNLALLYHRQGRGDEALAAIRRVMELGNVRPPALNDYAHVLLKAGPSLHEALEAYEYRWPMLTHQRPWDYYIPEWQGQSLEGKRLLFHAEQGFGDSIMCLRFVRDLEALGASVVVCIQSALMRLVEAQGMKALALESFDAYDVEGFDYQSPMYSAMRWLGVEWDTIRSEPYIKAPYAWLPDLSKKFNVGICWASGKRGTALDYLRRVSRLEEWLQLGELPAVQLYSLQKGEEATDIRRLGAEALVIDHTPSLKDWAYTCAYMQKLDLIISVDTAVAHLAGAIGKPIWMLSQFERCWRWYDIASGSGRPWYDSMRIYHQQAPGDWRSLLSTCAQDLRALVNAETQAKAA